MTARDLRTLLAHTAADPRTDAELLLAPDPPAFAALVRRHGPLVWAACRRMLPDGADAADAFQAVFLALHRSRRRLRTPAAVGGWLHAAAVRVCLQQRRAAARRRQRERRAAVPEPHTPVPDAAWDAMLAAVHEEVERLPAGERTAFVVCELQGVPQPEAAARLGWKPGTLTGRLSRARAKLLARLSARGVAPAAGLVGVGTLGVPAEVAATAGPGAWASPAVVALSREVTRMVATKHLAAALLVAGGLLAGVGGGLRAQKPADPPKPAAPKPTPPDPAPPPAAGHPKWEYRFTGRPWEAAEFAKLLRRLGGEGWEFAGIVAAKNDDDHQAATAAGVLESRESLKIDGPIDARNFLVFKRPVAVAAAPPAALLPSPLRAAPPGAAVGGGTFGGGTPPDPDVLWGFVSKGQPTVNLNDPANARTKERMQRDGAALPADGILTKDQWTAYFQASIARRQTATAPPGPAPSPALETLNIKMQRARAGDVANLLRELLAESATVSSVAESNTVSVTAAPANVATARRLVEWLDRQAAPAADLLPSPVAPPPTALVGVLADTLAERPLSSFDEVLKQVRAANPRLAVSDKPADLQTLQAAVATRLARDAEAAGVVWNRIGGDGVTGRLDISPEAAEVRTALERWGLVMPPAGPLTFKQFHEQWQVRPLGLTAATKPQPAR